VFAGPTFGALLYITGTRQGQVVIYRENSYPFHALGDVTFLWQPITSASCKSDGGGTTLSRHLWIWMHPACYSDIFTELRQVFRLTEAHKVSEPVSSGAFQVDDEMAETRHRKRKKKRKGGTGCLKRLKLGDDSRDDTTVAGVDRSVVSCNTLSMHDESVEHMTEAPVTNQMHSPTDSASTVPVDSKDDVKQTRKISGDTKKRVWLGDQHLLSKTEPVRIAYENGDVRLESLKDELCRFRLIGPKSHRVIVDAIRLVKTTCSAASNNPTENPGGDRQCSADVQKRWWDEYVESERGSAETRHQANSWDKAATMQSASELPPFSVYGLTVRDPRLFLPRHKTSASHSASGEST